MNMGWFGSGLNQDGKMRLDPEMLINNLPEGR